MISQAQKIGLCLLAVGSVAGVSVGAVAFKETQNSQVETKATVLPVGAKTPGNTIYVNFANTSWWHGENDCKVYFWDGSNNNAWSAVMTLVPNDPNVLEVAVPAHPTAGATWTGCSATRTATGTTGFGNKNANLYNQTTDFNLTATINSESVNCITLSDSKTGSKQNWGSAVYAASTRIEKWRASTELFKMTSGDTTCDSNGNTVQTALKTNWATDAVTYAAIPGAEVKSYFQNLTGDPTATDNSGAAARYDYIRSHHTTWNLSNFASR